MVALEVNLDHKRAPLVTITEQGASVLGEISKAQASWINQLSDGLTEQEVKRALKLLQLVRDRTEEIESTNSG